MVSTLLLQRNVETTRDFDLRDTDRYSLIWDIGPQKLVSGPSWACLETIGEVDMDIVVAVYLRRNRNSFKKLEINPSIMIDCYLKSHIFV